MSVSNDEQLIDFNVTNMGGNTIVYKVSSIEELRVRMAMQDGVLSPCILLFKALDNRMIEDTHEEPLAELRSVNNLEAAKQEVINWAFEKWIDVSKLHLRYGDQNFLEHAGPLISADERFDEKMHEWVINMILSQEAPAVEDVKAAIALGIDIMSVRRGDGWTLLHAAATYVHVEPLDTLLKTTRIEDLNMRSDLGNTPLRLAVVYGRVEALRSLLNAGGDPSLVEYHGFAPIHAAAVNGRVDVLTPLIEAGVDVNVTGENGHTPLHVASVYGQLEIIRTLVEAGADVNVTDEDGRTPLHEASKRGLVQTIGILMEAGANEDARDKIGETPYDCAYNEVCKRALRGIEEERHS